MNKKLIECIQKQQLRRIHRGCVKKVRSLHEESLYATFVQPFTDIVDAAKLASKDVLNATKLSLDTLLLFNPRKLAEARKNYSDRKSEIAKEWEPILKRNREAMSTGDADILAMVMAPHLFVASEVALQLWDKTEDIYDFLDKSGWRLPFSSVVLGGTATVQDSPKGSEEKSLMQKLKALFFLGEARFDGDNVIVEQKQEKPSLQKALAQYFKESGLDTLFSATTDKLLELEENYLENVIEPALRQLEFLYVIADTTDPREFVAAIKKAQADGIDVSATGLEHIVPQVEKDVQRLVQSEDFISTVAEEQSVTAEDISDQELKKAAEKVVFTQAKISFEEQLKSGSSSVAAGQEGKGLEEIKVGMRSKMQDMLDEITPSDAGRKAFETHPQGQGYLKRVDSAKQRLGRL